VNAHVNPMLQWALHYAARGWHVFPTPGGEKKSHKSSEFSNGQRWGATRNQHEICDDFSRWPDAGIGIPTGVENGFFVIETDTKNGKAGESELAKLQAERGALPTTYSTISPSGSIHYYFRHPGPDFYITSSTNKIAPGIDVKGDAGMVLAPPTERNGARYELRVEATISDAPQWLLDKVARKITDEEKRFVKHAPPDDAPTVKPWEIAKLERWVREAVRRDREWFAERENALHTVWGIKRAGYGREGYRIAQIICEAFPETQRVDRIDRFWNDSGASKGTVSLNSFWKHCAGIGIGQTPDEHAEWRKDEGDEAMKRLGEGSYELPPGAKPYEKQKSTETEASPPGIRPRRIDAATLHGKAAPEREWLVPGLIPARNVTLLYGDGGTGKSLLALQLAAAVVTGSLFFGRPVRQGVAEFITAEDEHDELHRRLADIARATGKGPFAGLHLTSLAESEALLAVPEDGRGNVPLVTTALYKELEQVLTESKPALLVLDTLADIYGGNEIVRAQVRQFVGMLRKLAIGHGCTVVVLAHPSLAGMDKGTSGSTAWNNSVRSRLFFQRLLDETGEEVDDDARVLRVGKSNYGKVGTEIIMRWHRGIFVPVEQQAGPDPLTQSWKAEAVFLELLDKANKDKVNVSNRPNANNYAPKMFVKDALKKGVKKRDLADAMNRMLESGKIQPVPYGPPSAATFKLDRNTMHGVVRRGLDGKIIESGEVVS
jgi:RecA-family ATPase